MKGMKKLIAIIALLLALVMMFTSCEALDSILGQLPGFEDTTPGDGGDDDTGTGEKPKPNPDGGNQGGDNSGNQGGDNSGNQGGDNSGNQGGDNSGNQGGDNSGNQGGDNSGNQGGDNSGNQGGDNSGNQGGDNSGNQGGDNSGNQGGDNSGNQGGDNTGTGVIETPATNTAYKFGMVQGNLANKVYYLAGGMAQTYYLATTENVSEAVDVYLEQANGGYYLYYQKGTTKSYINIEKVTGSDGKEHVNAKLESTGKTVYTYDSSLKTVTVKIDGATYALGTRNDKEYNTVGPCDVSMGSFICQFYAQGGADNTGNGDNGGNQGGDNDGNQGGNGNTGSDSNPFENGFALGLIPEPDMTSSSFNGYYIVNNNVPFFTDSEKATTTCFETYSSLDSLGRVGVAFACVCNNTMPTGDREGQSYKPTGWVQNTSYSGLDHLYDRSHLIAWSLAGENDTKENLATGTVYMNQQTMQIFENRVLNYLKENRSTNKVLYRVTPVFNGSNLLCSGVLMEAYSLDDNGADIQFCVFVYNVQKGVHLDYATGKNNVASSASDYGTGAGFGTGAGNSGTTGGNTDSGDNGNQGGNSGNQGGTTVTPVAGDKYIVSAANGNGTIYFTGTVTGGRFDGSLNKSEAAEVLVSTVDGGFVLSVGSQYIVMDDKSAGASLTTDAGSATVFVWNASLNTYVVADPDNARAFGCQNSSTYSNFSSYATSNTSGYNWGVFTKVGTSEGDNTGSGDNGGNTGDNGGNTGNSGTTGGNQSGSTDEQGEYSFVLNKSSKKIHCYDTSCTMSDKNRVEWTGSYEELQELLNSGYTTCGTCKPSLD